MPKTLKQRRQTYFDLSTALAHIDTNQIIAQLDNSKPFTSWGRNQTLDVGGTKVFVKRVPVTTIEQANMFSTANIYSLPTYFNYGIGSMGMGIFRELITHIKTTNWVLSGEHESFPLLYHYRFVPLSGGRADVNQAEHDKFITYWGSNENVSRYVRDRANATVELLLFLEHIPNVMHPWLLENFVQLPDMLDKLGATIGFLHQKGILHFDAHQWNVLTDGERIYLTDFGLVLDKSFELITDERTFYDANTNYDYGEMLGNIALLGVSLYRQLPDAQQQKFRQKYDVPEEEDNQFPALLHAFSYHFEEIDSSGLIPLHETHLSCLRQYRKIIQIMYDFFSAISDNPQKDTPFPNRELAHLLAETDFAN